MLFGWVDVRTSLVFISVGLMAPLLVDSTIQLIRKFEYPTQNEIEIAKLKAQLYSKLALNHYPEIGTLFEKLDLQEQTADVQRQRSFRTAILLSGIFFFLGIIATVFASKMHVF